MKSRLNAFIEKNRHGFLLLYFCIYFPWFHHLERTVTTHFHVIHTALDDRIPFCEYFIVPYLLWFGYVAWAVGYFYFKNKDEYFKLCAMLFTGMTKAVRYGSAVLMVLIILSTMFLKQHSVFDVVTGMVLAVFMYSVVYTTNWAAVTVAKPVRKPRQI